MYMQKISFTQKHTKLDLFICIEKIKIHQMRTANDAFGMNLSSSLYETLRELQRV